MKNLKYLLGNISETCFEEDPNAAGGDGSGDGGGAPAGDGGGAPAGDGGAGDPPKTFTQEDVNRMMADDRRKHQDQTKKALSELDALKSKSRLTQQERDDLDQRIQKMENTLLTKEELAAQDKKKLTKQHETQVNDLTSDRDSWKNRFTTSAIRREITDAAVKFDAYNPSQIVALLQSQTRLVEEQDSDGQPTGRFKPEIQFDDINKEGKPVTLTLTPAKAVERMKELSESMNLFKGTGVGGLGKNNQPGGKKLDAKELAKDPVAYRKARQEGTLKF